MKKYFISFTILGIVAIAFVNRQKSSLRHEGVVSEGAVANSAGQVKSLKDKTLGSHSSVSQKQASTSEADIFSDRAKVSLQEMSQIVADTIKGSRNLESLINRLKQTGQSPVVTRSGGTATGSMMIVRTKSPLPGTRYFHAQYFTDENNQRFPQHMSFEFKPGPNAMSDAVKTATQVFSLGEPTDHKADFIQWDLDDDYVLWIKKKSLQDLEDDAFNAYDKKTDVGTVQVTVEMRIHDDDHEHH